VEGLENKLDGVHVGDLVMLQSPQLEASGYVANFNPKQVTLSHENPFSEESHKISCIHRYDWSIGDRTYNLKHFKSYEVLREYKPTEKSE
jgi:hypothetical protein